MQLARIENTIRKMSGAEEAEGATVQKQSCWPEDPDDSKGWLVQVYRRWTYCYMGAILKKGSKQTKNKTKKSGVGRLSQDDLFLAPKSMEAAHLSALFHRHYQDVANDPQRRKVGKKKRLLVTLWRLAAPTFVPAGFCQLLSVLCQVALPLLVGGLLRVLEEHPKQKVTSEGLPFAIGIFGCTFVNAFANHRHRHLAMKSGIVMRASAVTILYEHVLRLSPKGKRGLTTGNVTTLIATDTQKLFEVSQEGHLIWALPLSIILVTICLLLVMGPTTLVGIAVLVLFVPLVERVTSRMLAIRHDRVKMTDKRVGIVSAMLQGIKVVKLNSYEENYDKHVTEARKDELYYLRKELAVWALTLVLTVISPMLATAATFAVYVLIDEENILTASISFSVLLLFSALRFPINFAGRLLGKATQAYSAVQRIAQFLEREVRDDVETAKNVRTVGACTSYSPVKVVAGVQSISLVVDRDGQGKNYARDASTENKDIVCKSTKSPVPENTPLQLKNASFYIESVQTIEKTAEETDEDSDSLFQFQVSRFDVTVQRGEVLAVCGPVGGGKSLLVNGIIDETPSLTETIVTTNGQIGFAPQVPFILNSTLRENILFGREFKEDLYNRVLDACCLRTDIELLGSQKDLTEIGERGVTLSGGQKQRVSLARVAYAQPDLVLLDDPLSALDAGTSKLVFNRLIKGSDALFANAAVVLVTHASHFLNRVDNIIVIVEGKNRFTGSWDKLVTFEAHDESTKGAIDFIRTSVQEEESGNKVDNLSRSLAVESMQRSNTNEKTNALMTVEEREHGLSSLSTWLLWFKHAGGVFFLSFQIIFMAIDRFSYVAVEYWLARWTDGADSSVEAFGIEFPPQTDGRSAQYKYLAVFSSILLVSILSTVVRSEWIVTGGARAAKNVFYAMLTRVLGAPMSYFESTPMGRILNRFTYDTEVIDVTLTQTMSMFLISCSWYIAGVCVMSAILPWMILAIVPVTLVYWLLLLHYRKSGSDLQRIDALSRSPLQALLSEGLDGAPSIRLFGKYSTFVERFHAAVNVNSAALLSFVTAQRWLGLRIELLGTVIVLVASVLIITLNDIFQIEAGLVGLLILWSSNFTITLGFLVDTFAETEASITAMERVDAMSQIPQEKARTTDKEFAVPKSWPEEGKVEFDRACLRYRKGLPLALDELSFVIAPGLKVGVVGRTGAGKSSITVALFRLVEIESGQIKLDGRDLGKLGLSDVRGRGMSIIPQDPFLAGSSLRECLDPFGQSSDGDVLEALRSVRLASNKDTPQILDTIVEEGGLNYSVGERQLLNLARVLLSKPRLVVLDEATASIDGERDAFIQGMLRTKFKDTTLITIAHRLNTIMDYDAVLVMDEGRAAEFGSPAELLQNEGIFAELVDATGPEGSKALRALVRPSSL